MSSYAKLGFSIFAISAIILAVSVIHNKSGFLRSKSNFGEVNDNRFYSKTYGGNGLDTTRRLQDFQDSIVMNSLTSVEQVNSIGAQYYSNLQNYLSPSRQNLEMASNISAEPVEAGLNRPGAHGSYSNINGNGYVDNLGSLGSSYGSFATVSYKDNDRASQLSKCAKDLPMFAASSLLPKPSSNADSHALNQTAARALSAWTNLAPAEQIGALTSLGNMPFGKTVSERPVPLIPKHTVVTPMFHGSSALGIPVTFGSFNSNGQPGTNSMY